MLSSTNRTRVFHASFFLVAWVWSWVPAGWCKPHLGVFEATTETIPMEEVEPVVQVKPEVEKVEEKKVEELKVGSPGTCWGEGFFCNMGATKNVCW